MHHDPQRTIIALLGLFIWTTTQASGAPPSPATSAEIAELIAKAGTTDDYEKADLVHLLDEADVYVQESGLATTESCEIIKVLTDKGVRTRSVLRYEFDPDTYHVTIQSVRIHRADGSIDDVDMSAMLTQPTKQRLIFWGGKQNLLTLPHLAIGDTIELRISKIGFNIAYLGDGASGGASDGGGDLVPPMPGHWYEVTRFQRGHPIVKKRYSVHMPRSMPIQYEVYNGSLRSSLWMDGDRFVYTFSAEDVSAVKREPHMTARDDNATKLVVATLPTWEEKSRWFHEVNETQFEADDDIRAKVRELTAGLATDEERIAACVHWVADNIRYYGTKRGACEGFTLHRSIETFRDRGGVCKDKAGMLVTMLRVLGMDSFPTLTMAGSRVEAIPADQFNHTVTGLRNADGSIRVLDPTWAPLSRELWSSREAVQGIVHGTPEGQPLTLSPYFAPESNLVDVRAVGRIAEDGTLRTEISMDLKGYPCTSLRRSVARRPVPVQRAAIEEVLNIAANARLEAIDQTDPYDYARDSRLDMTVSAAGYAAGGEDTMMFRLPLMRHPLSKWLTPEFAYSVEKEERSHGMRLRATRLVRYEETIELPPGWTVTKTPDPVSMDSPAVSLTFEATPDDGKLTYHFELVIKGKTVKPDDYPDYRKTMLAMNKIADGWVVCGRSRGPGEIADRSVADGRQGGTR